MIHVFRIKGFSGFLMLLGVLCLAFTFLAAFPAAIMMALWNATVFEMFQGPEVSLLQGAILWAITAIGIVLVFRPKISIEFKSSPEEPKINKPQ